MTRWIAATALLITVAGCGVTSTRRAVDTAAILGSLASQLGGAAERTYTAGYSTAGAGPVTVVHRPTGTAYLTAGESRFIVTDDHLIRCAATCYRAPNRHADLGADPGFPTPEWVQGYLAAAAFGPRARAKLSERTIGGQEATCADVTGTAEGFTVCVTGSGDLASFRGTAGTVELIRVTGTADPAAFATPPGIPVVDVPSLPPR